MILIIYFFILKCVIDLLNSKLKKKFKTKSLKLQKSTNITSVKTAQYIFVKSISLIFLYSITFSYSLHISVQVLKCIGLIYEAMFFWILNHSLLYLQFHFLSSIKNLTILFLSILNFLFDKYTINMF